MGQHISSLTSYNLCGEQAVIPRPGKRQKTEITKSKGTETASCWNSANSERPKSQPNTVNTASSTDTSRVERYAFNPTNHLPFPPEIRNKIYRYLLTCPCYLGPNYGDCRYCPPSDIRPPLLDLSILRVSKQTFLESWHVLYAVNTIGFSSTDALLAILQHIGYERRQQVVRVSFKWLGKDPKAAFRLLKTCSRLSSIKFNLCYYEPKGYAALKEVRGMKEIEIHHQQFAACACLGQSWNFNERMHLDKRVLSDPAELKEAMMRPRLKRYKLKEEEEFNLLKPKKEIFRKPEEHWLGWK